MRHAPVSVEEWLLPALRRGFAAVGILALVIAAISTVSTPGAFALFDTHHKVAVTDCLGNGGDGCGSHQTGNSCTLHAGCVVAGVLGAGPVVITAPGHDWTVYSGASVAGWTDFPDKPPPILL